MNYNVMAILNLEEREQEIRGLTAFRPIATIPLAGRYRVIDFILSNLVNAGIRQVGIFSKKSTRSLVGHISAGKPWDLNLKHSGLFLFDHPLLGDHNYDAKLFANNMEFLKKSEADYVILSSSYMIYNMDLQQVIEKHRVSGNEITVLYHPVSDAYREFLNCYTLQFDEHNMLTGYSKNIGADNIANLCMELFVMKKEMLIRLIHRAVQMGEGCSFCDFLMKQLHHFRTGGICYHGYVSCINSTASYYRTNMELLTPQVREDLFCSARPVYTKIKDGPPTLYTEGSRATDSLVADGCIISGTVHHSIISRFVTVSPDALVQNCIVLQGAVIHEGARLNHAIIEKGAVVYPGTVISGTPDFPAVIEKKLLQVPSA
ncbi:MAG: glucose-1-phosphate adenylyltransferase subunit GlgD [Ruminococcaceae bacterium]|nr:glucose-1-phosphate adenylyltransferase subunit GlgD [Oscillospiraceae bacterium]